MKYILILAVIIGAVTYIFLSGPKPSDVRSLTNRREAVWDKIAELEHRRQNMLIVAQGRMASYGNTRERYFVVPADLIQSTLFASAENTRNPLFFNIP